MTDGGQSRPLVRRLLAVAAQALRDSREQAVMRLAAARLAYQSARVTAALLLAVNAGSAALLVTYIFLSGELLARIPVAARGGWGSAAGGAVAGYLAAVGACFLGAQVLAPVKTRLGDLVLRQVDGSVRGRLAAASVRLPGLYLQAYLAALLVAVLLSPRRPRAAGRGAGDPALAPHRPGARVPVQVPELGHGPGGRLLPAGRPRRRGGPGDPGLRPRAVAARQPVHPAGHLRDPAGMPRESLRLEAVSFRYPGSDRLVLDGLTLEVPAGKSLAVVGLNGAGKTTLVKLVAGLYQPTRGTIRADGVDLRELRTAAWQRNVAAIYQDFERYQLPAAENIAFADAADPARRGDIAWAAAQAGVLAVLEALPRGLDTPLAAGYAGGADLSGGQWQTVALARSMMRDAPLVLILDEPTASLDAHAEYVLFGRYAARAREVAHASGGICVLVSHRFSTVRMADQIIVMEAGRITESGSHGALMERGGLYASLCRLQAAGYL